ncbi:MAG: hypothetical protein Q8942_12750, partial [Bacillota bacterium]|nr:hypothetical protein [Bacillota bacterium]
MFDKIRTVYIGLESLTVYRKLLEDEVIASFSQLIKYINNNDIELVGFVNYYSKFYFKLTQRNSLSSFASYIINSIIYDDNVFSNYIEKESSKDLDTNLQKAVEHDLDSLQKVAELSAEEIKNYVINV